MAVPPAPPVPPTLLDPLDPNFALDMNEFRLQMDDFKQQMDVWKDEFKDTWKDEFKDDWVDQFKSEFKFTMPTIEIGKLAQGPRPVPQPVPPKASVSVRVNSPAEGLYDSAHDSIDAGRYDRAIDQLDRLISQYEGRPDPMANRVDAAMYWKAYAQMKESAFKEAQATLESLQQKFADSRWLKDAKALSVEVQQAAGQRVSPDAQNDEEIKLLALRGLMQADPDRALPMIEQILAGNSSVRVKENALFVLSQSRDPRTRGIITSVARGGNPDLQLRAVRYLGAMRTPESRQSLQEIYRSTTDAAVKRSILQAYQNSDSIDQLSEIAKNEKDPQIRRQAIRYIGAMQRRNAGSSELLKSLYNAESDLDIKKEIVSSLASGQNAATLVELAKAEKNPEATRYIVSRLSTMKSKEATDYMVELLK